MQLEQLKSASLAAENQATALMKTETALKKPNDCARNHKRLRLKTKTTALEKPRCSADDIEMLHRTSTRLASSMRRHFVHKITNYWQHNK